MNERGFTLGELLVSVALIGVVMAGVFVLQQQGQLSYLWVSARVEAQQNARLALDLMTRELRSALALTSATGCSNATTGTSTISFVDASNNTVTYALSGASAPYAISRTYAGTASDLVGGVVTFRVFCYKQDGYVLTEAVGQIGSVKLVIETQSEASGESGSLSAQHTVLESRVKLRNL